MRLTWSESARLGAPERINRILADLSLNEVPRIPARDLEPLVSWQGRHNAAPRPPNCPSDIRKSQ